MRLIPANDALLSPIRKNLSIPLILFSFFPFDLNFSMLLKWQPSSSARWLYKSLLFLTSAVGFLLFFSFVSFFVKFMRTFFAHVACPNWACVRFGDSFSVHCKWICHCRAKKYPYNLVYTYIYIIYHNGVYTYKHIVHIYCCVYLMHIEICLSSRVLGLSSISSTVAAFWRWQSLLILPT